MSLLGADCPVDRSGQTGEEWRGIQRELWAVGTCSLPRRPNFCSPLFYWFTEGRSTTICPPPHPNLRTPPPSSVPSFPMLLCVPAETSHIHRLSAASDWLCSTCRPLCLLPPIFLLGAAVPFPPPPPRSICAVYCYLFGLRVVCGQCQPRVVAFRFKLRISMAVLNPTCLGSV